MQRAHAGLQDCKGLQFYKMLGTGAGAGFSLRPDFSTYAFLSVWDSEDDFNTYFAKRVERSGEDFARLLVGPPEKECFQTDDWGYGKEWQK